jgi:hypothetical protein
VYLCYIDESGTSDIPGNTSHFILAGISIPVDRWRYCDGEIQKLKKKYDLEDAELHTAWMLRKYLEQKNISGFDSMSYAQRKYEVNKKRNIELLRLQQSNNKKRLSQTGKNFKKTDKYTHPTYSERVRFIDEVADCFSG